MKEDDLIAAEYVLGLARGEPRRLIEERMGSDAGLRSCVERWQEHFAPLAREGMDRPSNESYEAILAQIDLEGSQLPGSVTLRAAEAGWLPLSEGVSYRVLREQKYVGRQSLLIRMQPGATYRLHLHDSDEECLVIEGDLWFGDLELRSGDFHVALKGTTHPISRTVSGCLLHISSGPP